MDDGVGVSSECVCEEGLDVSSECGEGVGGSAGQVCECGENKTWTWAWVEWVWV